MKSMNGIRDGNLEISLLGYIMMFLAMNYFSLNL